MREFIIADNQDITKAGMMFLLSSQKDTALLLEADNKAELVQQLRLHPQAVVILDYTLFDFSGADELIVLHERFKEADWLLFSDELSMEFLRQVLFSSMAFGVVLKDNSKEEIVKSLQRALNKDYNCGLDVDGIIGPLTTKAVNNNMVRNFTVGEFAKWVQERLIAKGYSLNEFGVDGRYGDESEKKVKEFQANCDIDVDGIVGINTVNRLI